MTYHIQITRVWHPFGATPTDIPPFVAISDGNFLPWQGIHIVKREMQLKQHVSKIDFYYKICLGVSYYYSLPLLP